MGIGAQVRKYRLKAGWTLEVLSEASGVEPGTIGALEVRDSNRSKYFAALAKAFGLSMEQLCDEAKEYPIPGPLTTVKIDASYNVVPSIASEEQTRPYLWPFKELKPHEWELLSDTERQHIEDGALMLIRARADPKHQAPAKTIASA